MVALGRGVLKEETSTQSLFSCAYLQVEMQVNQLVNLTFLTVVRVSLTVFLLVSSLLLLLILYVTLINLIFQIVSLNTSRYVVCCIHTRKSHGMSSNLARRCFSELYTQWIILTR